MFAATDTTGPENDKHLINLARDAGVVVAAWSTNGTHLGCDQAVRAMVSNLHCLRKTQAGHPGHLLYLLGNLKPVTF